MYRRKIYRGSKSLADAFNVAREHVTYAWARNTFNKDTSREPISDRYSLRKTCFPFSTFHTTNLYIKRRTRKSFRVRVKEKKKKER